ELTQELAQLPSHVLDCFVGIAALKSSGAAIFANIFAEQFPLNGHAGVFTSLETLNDRCITRIGLRLRLLLVERLLKLSCVHMDPVVAPIYVGDQIDLGGAPLGRRDTFGREAFTPRLTSHHRI